MIPNNQSYWIGLADFDDEGTFVWQYSQTVATYGHWSQGQPDDFGGGEGEDCTEMVTSPKVGDRCRK